ncbi:MAG: FAD-dependent oxidoreductase, partial [Desulfobacterales bacterium]|nr:FAD-dependent oxidoreductase [Desulfobacterales bacterium]
MKIVIIGYGPAAIKALEAVERHVGLHHGRKPDVTVISSEKADPYAPMFLIKYLTGQLTANQLQIKPKGGGYAFPFQEVLGHRAVGVLDKEKRVVLEEGREIGFDKLLIANGAAPIIPAVKGLDKEGVFFLSRLHDAERISSALGEVRDVV